MAPALSLAAVCRLGVAPEAARGVAVLMPPPRRCRGCYQNVELHAGCTVARVTVMGETHERVRHGALHGRCPECGTIANGYHHVGCPAEECPVCGRRRCGCGKAAVASGRSLGVGEPWEATLGTEEKVG